jgi:hypothetical protein
MATFQTLTHLLAETGGMEVWGMGSEPTLFKFKIQLWLLAV